MEEVEYQGHWWLPGQSNDRVGGVLHFHPDEMPRLSLFQALDNNPENFDSDSALTFPKLVGLTTEGTPVTLVNCKRDKYNSSSNQQDANTSSEYVLSYVLLGYRFENENPAFDTLNVGFPYQEDWSRLSSLDMSFQINQNARVKPGHEFSISYTVPDSPSAWVDDIEISLKMDGKTNFTRFRESAISLESYFEIDPKRPQVPLSEYMDWVAKLNNFLALACDRAIAPKTIEGIIDGTDVEIRYPTEGIREAESQVNPFSFLFHYHYISGNFSDVLSKWFWMSEELKPALDLYFGAQFNQRMYENNTFLSLAQAVESYHRFTKSGQYQSDYKYEEIYDDFKSFLYGDLDEVYNHTGSLKSGGSLGVGKNLKNLDEMYNLDNDFINKMKDGTLKYANEYSLRKRLSELVDDHISIINDLPYNIADKQGEVIDTRNYLTHYDPSLKSRASTGKELTKLTWGLQQLLEVCLLDQIGIHEDIIRQRLNFKYGRKMIT